MSPITCTATFTPSGTDVAGTYTMAASYAGDGNYTSSSSAQVNNFVITKPTPVVTVTNVAPASELYGNGTQTVVTAQLTWVVGGVSPTGGLAFTSTAGGSYGTPSCRGEQSDHVHGGVHAGGGGPD